MKALLITPMCVLLLAGCASEAETAGLNAAVYQRCVQGAEINAADPAVECGASAASFRPSFGQKFSYLYETQRAQQVQQSQQRAAQPAQQVQQVQQANDPC